VDRSCPSGRLTFPAVADPALSDQPPDDDDYLREGHPEIDDLPPPLRAPHELLVSTVAGIGAFHHPPVRGLQGSGLALLGDFGLQAAIAEPAVGGSPSRSRGRVARSSAQAKDPACPGCLRSLPTAASRGDWSARLWPRSFLFFLPLFTGVRGRGILRTSPLSNSPKFAPSAQNLEKRRIPSKNSSRIHRPM
jgi:hypothetical protein